MTEHIDLEPLTRGAARLALAVIEKDDAALTMAASDLCERGDGQLVETLRDLIAGWVAVMLIALRDQGMDAADAPAALHNALRIHLGRDVTT